MKLSVLEQSTLSEGSTAAEAISNTVSLSRELDRLGYNRIWVSEHHNLNILQGSTPEVLLAAIGTSSMPMFALAPTGTNPRPQASFLSVVVSAVLSLVGL